MGYWVIHATFYPHATCYSIPLLCAATPPPPQDKRKPLFRSHCTPDRKSPGLSWVGGTENEVLWADMSETNRKSSEVKRKKGGGGGQRHELPLPPADESISYSTLPPESPCHNKDQTNWPDSATVSLWFLLFYNRDSPLLAQDDGVHLDSGRDAGEKGLWCRKLEAAGRQGGGGGGHGPPPLASDHGAEILMIESVLHEREISSQIFWAGTLEYDFFPD